MFHVSVLKKYVHDPSHVIEHMPFELKEDLSYVETPVEILDKEEKTLRNKVINLVKVRWQHHGVSEATWATGERNAREVPPPICINVS